MYSRDFLSIVEVEIILPVVEIILSIVEVECYPL